MTTLRAIADTHLHLYPDYDIDTAFNHFIRNTPLVTGQGKDQIRIACLAERHDCDYFDSIRSKQTVLRDFDIVEADSAKGLTKASDQPDSNLTPSNVLPEIVLQSKVSAERFTLLPGRQVISSENIEVLALACHELIPDGLPAAEIIRKVNQIGGLPVVAWSPGKWFFSRGKVVKALLSQFSPADFVIGDTSLRPYFWGLPLLMRKAKRLGFHIVAGSDPLPFAGEESWYGAYTSEIEGQASSATELITGLKCVSNTAKPCNSSQCLRNAGKRSWPLGLLKRLKANAASK